MTPRGSNRSDVSRANAGPFLPFLPLVVSEWVLEEAADLAARYGLRADDAVQLATAAVARSAGVQLGGFLCFDTDLAAAAAREGWLAVG